MGELLQSSSSPLGRSHHSIANGGQTSFNSYIEATKDIFDWHLPPRSSEERYVRKSKGRQRGLIDGLQHLDKRLISTGTISIMAHPGTAHTVFFMRPPHLHKLW